MDSWVTLAAAILGSGGITAAIVALLKVRPEAGQIVVTTSERAVVIQSGVIEDLNAQLERQEVRHNEEMERQDQKLQRYIEDVENLRRSVAQMEGLRRDLDGLKIELERVKQERDQLESEKEELTQRVTELEAQVVDLQNGRGGKKDETP